MKSSQRIFLLAAVAIIGCTNSPTDVITWQLAGASTPQTVLVGDQTTLAVEEVHNGVRRAVPNSDLTWRVVSGDAITVSAGVVVSIVPGSAVVAAIRGVDTVTFTVNVASRPIVAIQIAPLSGVIRRDTFAIALNGTEDRGGSRPVKPAQLISRSPQLVQVLPDGHLVALEAGSAVLVAEYGALRDSITVVVGLGAVDQLGMQFTTDVAAGDSVLASFSPVDQRGNPLTGVVVSVYSGNTTVADVRATTVLSQDGVWIKAKVSGLSTIHASSGTATSAIILNVSPARVIGLQARASSGFFFWQDSVTLSVTALLSDGTTGPLQNGVTWSVMSGADKFAVTGNQLKTVGPTFSGSTRRDIGVSGSIRASFGSLTADVSVSAGSQRPTALIVSGPDGAQTGSTVALTLSYLDSLGYVVPANRIVGATTWALPTGAIAQGSSQWQVTVPGNALFVAMYTEPGVGLVSGNKTVVVTDVFVPPPSVYVELEFVGSASPAVTAAFVSAQNRINSIISYSNANPVTFSISAGACGTGIPAFNGTVQGVKIFAQVATIDGVGGILGQAGPCIIRSNGFHFPALGSMTFDVADLNSMANNGTLVPVILHEMFHVMGFGTIWGYSSYFFGSGTSNPRWTGPLAKGEYQLLGAADFASGLPIENTGGPGTANSHWKESIFSTELMTGWIGSVAPLSRMTIASLADQGYQVSYAAADPYTLPGSVVAGAGVNIEPAELLELPRFVVTPAGNLAGIAGAPAWRNVFNPM